MKRDIVKIEEEKCTGCGQCIPNCHEGALRVIDGKAVLISDLMCDGLGACLGHCPEGALEIETRDTEAYDEFKVMGEMVKKTRNVVVAHLMHLKDHREMQYLKQGIGFLETHASDISMDVSEIISELNNYNPGQSTQATSHGESKTMHIQSMLSPESNCPGAQSKSFVPAAVVVSEGDDSSSLTQWPVQMHLINPGAAHFRNSDFLLAADCVAYALGGFHSKFLKGKTLGIACPKFDTNKEIYLEKLVRLIDDSKINTISVMIMEVPCCGGLLQLVMNAGRKATRKVPVKVITVGVQGEILSDNWM